MINLINAKSNHNAYPPKKEISKRTRRVFAMCSSFNCYIKCCGSRNRNPDNGIPIKFNVATASGASTSITFCALSNFNLL